MDTIDSLADENMRLKMTLGKFQGEIRDLKLQLEASQKTTGKIRLSWEGKKSDSGIELVGGVSTVTRKGTLVGTTLAPVGPNQMGLLLVVLEDGASWGVVSAEMATVIP